jgi:tetratricopeptide (TPR) repeat protein
VLGIGRGASCVCLFSASAIALCAWLWSAHAVAESAGCAPVARIVSIQGTLQVQRAGQAGWSYVRKLDTTLCQGDLLHADAGSRAALLIIPETLVRLDQNSTIAIHQSANETLVELSIEAAFPRPALLHPNACGAGYFITRFPRRFRVITPFLHASVEGTEFLVAMRCESAQVAVFEGRVLAQDALATASQAISLNDGESLQAGGAEPAAVRLLVKPVDAVQWALYYPPLSSPGTDMNADQECDQATAEERARCLTMRAEQKLRAGRVDEAQRDIEDSLALARDNADADALLAVISVVKNDKARALEYAQRATEVDPVNPRAWIALSYAQQASFKLEDALKAAERAAELAPRSSTAQARSAELLMSLGRIKTAERAARAAVEANPNESRAHTVLGFVHLAQIDTGRAREDFLSAIERDSSDPLPRLGLGLAIIRDGHLTEGREQIEIAVVLDPTNALIRSYGGKAYYEENTQERDKLAAVQFGIAKNLDPNDPTPWFYDAILKQSQNRPVEALEDLQRSIELNDNRAVYRSRLLLDEDRAARAISLARTFRSLGFDQLAVEIASSSLEQSPGDYSAHRFLSDSYAALPRHEIARASELLQAKLLQPVSGLSVQPCLTDADAFTRRAGFPEAGFAELSELFERDGPHFFLNALAGDHQRYGMEGAITGSNGRLGYALNGCRYTDGGFRKNEDYDRNVYGGFLQLAVNPQLDIQTEVQRDARDFGDITYGFDPNFASPTSRNDAAIDTARLGLHYRSDADSHLLLSAIGSDRNDIFFVEDPGVFDARRNIRYRTLQIEGQYITRVGRTALTLGGGGGKINRSDDVIIRDFLTPSESTRFVDDSPEQYQLYGYARTTVTSGLTTVIGLTYDALRENPIDQNRLNPKVGVRWAPHPRLSVRGAAFRSARRFLIQNQTLEPTEIVGFNQFFDDFLGTPTTNYGIGVDARPTDRLFVGASTMHRKLSVPTLVLQPSGETWVFDDYDEHLFQAYAYMALTRRLSLSVEPSFEEFTRENRAEDPLATDVRTVQVPVTLRLAFPNGFLGMLGARYVHQDVDRLEVYRSVFQVGNEDYVLLDLSLGYRLPGRRGVVLLEVRNLTNQGFDYQDDNFIRRVELAPAGIFPERTAWVRVSLQF